MTETPAHYDEAGNPLTSTNSPSETIAQSFCEGIGGFQVPSLCIHTMKPSENYELLTTIQNNKTLLVYVDYKSLLEFYLKRLCDSDNSTDAQLLNYRRYVTGEFVRNYVNQHWEGLRMPRNFSRVNKRWIRLESKLCGENWRLIRLLSTTALEPSAETFYKLILDQKLMCFISVFEETTTTKYISKIQSENRILQNLNNPFDQCSYTTWQFIERAIREANRNPDFYKDYQKMVRARMEFITHIKALRPKLIDSSGNHEHRGRKPK
jgi:hypothetical protein